MYIVLFNDYSKLTSLLDYLKEIANVSNKTSNTNTLIVTKWVNCTTTILGKKNK